MLSHSSSLAAYNTSISNAIHAVNNGTDKGNAATAGLDDDELMVPDDDEDDHHRRNNVDDMHD